MRISLTGPMLQLGLALLLIGLFAIEESRVHRAQDRLSTLVLAQLNDSARRTPTIELPPAIEGDSQRVFQRLVVQQQQRADSLDRALAAERRGRYAMAIGVDSLERLVRASAVVPVDPVSREVAGAAVASGAPADSMRQAVFDVRQPPYTVTARVALPPAPDTGTMTLRITTDPIPLTLRLSCAGRSGDLPRSALITSSGPPWATVRFDSVEQSPELCAGPPKRGVRSWIRPAITVGVGRAMPGVTGWRWGGFVGIGWTAVWPP